MAIAPLTLGVLLGACTGARRMDEPREPPPLDFISRAVFAQDRLWLLSDSGRLSSVAAGQQAPQQAGLLERVLDICGVQGELRALTCISKACTTWSLERHRGDQWVEEAQVRADDDRVMALACSAQGHTILTSARLVEIRGSQVSAKALSARFRRSSVTSIRVVGDQLDVGVNAGEWGGGLRRIDRRTGNVSVVERNETGELCDGPLNTSCDPVNGIAEAPWKPGCVALAVGLVHLMEHGRIVEVCGDQIQTTYTKAPTSSDHESEATSFKGASVAFFGVIRVGDQLVAAGTDGIYRFRASGPPEWTALPEFESIGGIAVSFAVPDVVLVLTDVNRRRSVSGSVPLIVPRY
jgi:hypothetical protein